MAEILQSFPRVRFYLMFGQTEATARLSYLPPERLGDKLGSIGSGLASTKLEVLRPDGTPVMPGSAETGEIVATGDNIALGYWHDTAETARFFRNGRLYTGDIARVDADGFVYIRGRLKRFAKISGEMVSLTAVEEALANAFTQYGLRFAIAVLSKPDATKGEKLVAVTNEPKLTLDAVREALRARGLGNLSFPRELKLMRELPRLGSGKVNHRELERMMEEVKRET